MKKITTILILTVAFSIITSCSKSDEENIVDCFGDSILTELKHPVDETNPKKIDFSIEYFGSDRTLSNVKWTFGDGQTATGISVSHTYSAAGSYTVKAEVTTKKGNSSECTHDKTKTITVN
ncbi:MAG: PKD domain-containing protein [Flavobacterium sp.]|uniref:PKD domain-containing protein n=1 Tax=Flavobacterium sp. TaxID=239 RepID=UPI001B09196A|nr:PKD domain-containing protein [Flavobacterium sp.]MBO9582749.1 PKD domain-containing protein [Flavobacterium sp.]